MGFDVEVSVKDIINFYIKINDVTKAKKAIAKLSSKEKSAAFDIIESSQARREFKIEVAKFFVIDLDSRVRRKAEVLLETLVPGWVADPAESILKLLRSAGGKGVAQRNAAVKFLFGVIDANSLRDTFLTLLSSRNRAHMSEIIAILEDYIDSSRDEQEQVKIFDGCLDIVLSDDAEQSVKHHASNLLSVFFKKVATTQLGEILHQKYIERQVEKAEGVHRYLCSGASGLNGSFLDDLLRPLIEGGKVYQIKMITYFGFVFEKIRIPEEVDQVLDTYPDFWSQNEPPKEEKIRNICRRIMQALEELWDATGDEEVRGLIIGIKYGEYPDKRELLEQIKGRIEGEMLSSIAREKIGLMLRCFLRPDEEDAFKLQAAQLLMFKLGDHGSRKAALSYLKYYVENRNLNYAEKGSIAAVIESLLNEPGLETDLADMTRYIIFLATPASLASPENQAALLAHLRGVADGGGLENEIIAQRIAQSLAALAPLVQSGESCAALRYLESRFAAPSPDAVAAKPAPKK